MIGRIIAIGVFLIFNLHGSIISQTISERKAEVAAKHFLSEKYSKTGEIYLDKIYPVKFKDSTVFYWFSSKSDHVLISASKAIQPVLAYFEGGSYLKKGSDMPPGLTDLLNFYKSQLFETLQNNSSTSTSHKKWDALLNKNYKNSESKVVVPLLNVQWDQGAGWNRFCPEDKDGPGGNAYAGCVAVAMAQAMSKYEHPDHGYGEHTYTSSYGSLYVNFSNAEYNWSYMSDNQPDNYNSKLLYHCGVAVDMEYGAESSGAYTFDVPSALKEYFDYSPSVEYVSKSNSDDWSQLLKDELDQGRPIIYSGNDEEGENGHAFNIDGYDGDYFHLNWGWSGEYNGNFLLNNLKPGNSDFSYGHAAVIGIKPFDHSPDDIILSNKVVLQDQPIGTFVSVVNTEDPDKEEEHTYEVTDLNGFESSFKIENDTLKTNKIISYNPDKPKIGIKIIVTDKQNNSLEKEFQIIVKKENHSPSDIHISDTLIPRNVGYLDEVCSLKTIDQDTMDTFEYSFVQTEQLFGRDNENFKLEDSTIILKTTFDALNDTSYLAVQSNDGFGGEITKEFYLVKEKVKTSISSSKLSENRIQVFPNPTYGLISFSNLPNDNDLQVSLYSLSGRKIFSKPLYQRSNTIDLKRETGVYLITVSKNEQIIHKEKIIIK